MKKNLIFLFIVLLAVGGYFYYKKKKGTSLKTKTKEKPRLFDEEPKHPKSLKKAKIYFVQKGDTLFKIAKKNGLELEEILRANPQIKNGDLIHVKQKILIP